MRATTSAYPPVTLKRTESPSGGREVADPMYRWRPLCATVSALIASLAPTEVSRSAPTRANAAASMMVISVMMNRVTGRAMPRRFAESMLVDRLVGDVHLVHKRDPRSQVEALGTSSALWCADALACEPKLQPADGVPLSERRKARRRTGLQVRTRQEDESGCGVERRRQLFIRPGSHPSPKAAPPGNVHRRRESVGHRLREIEQGS